MGKSIFSIFLAKINFIIWATCLSSGQVWNYVLKPITRRQVLDSSKLKEFADDNFKFEKNGRKVSKRIENTVGKGEIARYEHFLLFPQCFQRLVSQGHHKVSLCGNGLKNNDQFIHCSNVFTCISIFSAIFHTIFFPPSCLQQLGLSRSPVNKYNYSNFSCFMGVLSTLNPFPNKP